ncbi:hypothetical protein ACGFXC_10370 [Streptomyces sp. NPDC048507]|uniref:hypothetical protein n=1 Tax=Streptomyces sp. NPDC048507 TaxID=3365560 RepID=UPI00371CEA04
MANIYGHYCTVCACVEQEHTPTGGKAAAGHACALCRTCTGFDLGPTTRLPDSLKDRARYQDPLDRAEVESAWTFVLCMCPTCQGAYADDRNQSPATA